MKRETIVTFWARENHGRYLRALSSGDMKAAHIALREYNRNMERLMGS